jgi:hypothetical protein
MPPPGSSVVLTLRSCPDAAPLATVEPSGEAAVSVVVSPAGPVTTPDEYCSTTGPELPAQCAQQGPGRRELAVGQKCESELKVAYYTAQRLLDIGRRLH